MAINKSSTEYYNLEKVSEVLSVSTAEVNRLREQSKLRGFRDGSNWKFLKDDVHSYLAESIKARSGSGQKQGDSDFDLAGEDVSAPAFDLLVEDAALPDDSDLISVAPSARPSSDLDLAALDHDSDLSLAEETQISSLAVPKKATPPKVPVSPIVKNDDDSSALILAAPESYEVELDGESVLGAGGSSAQLGLAGDSGFDVLVAGEGEEELFQVDGEKTDIPSPVADEFDLEPSSTLPGSDDSESSSQVIAIKGVAGTTYEADIEPDPFGQDVLDPADFAGFDSGISSPAQSSQSSVSDPFGLGGSSDAFETPFVAVSPKKSTVSEEEYSTGMLITLVSALVVMLLCGIMLLDTMVHMWSWGEPFILNSILMDTIAGWFGLL